MTLFAAFLAIILPESKPPGLIPQRLVDAAKAVEHARIDYVSPCGARGVYQIKEATWKQYSSKPFEWASEQSYVAQVETHRVALKHAHWIVEKAIPALRIPATPYSVGLIWNVGYGNVERLNLTDKNVDYARRFSNLYEDLGRNQNP